MAVAKMKYSYIFAAKFIYSSLKFSSMKASISNGVPTIYFSRWSRKAYAVFSTLGRSVAIARVHIVLSLLAMVSVAARAQQVQDSLLTHAQDLEEVEVSALEEPLAFSQLGRIITTISHAEIAAAPVHDLAGLLSMVQGVDIRQRGSHGMQADLSMRGGAFDQVLVLLNGIPMSDPQTGHFNLNVPIDLDEIDRIEVLRGPSASVFGANAYSGAVNIICKAKKHNRLLLKGSGGAHAYYDYGGALNLSGKDVRALVSFRQHASEGYMKNTDFLGQNLFANTSWQHRKLRVEASVGWHKKDFGANSFYSPKYPMQYERNEARVAALGLHWQGKLKTSLVPYYRQHRDNWQLLRDMPDVYQNFHQTDVWGLRGKSMFYSSWGKTTLGLDAKTEKIRSNTMGDKLQTPEPISWSKGHNFLSAYDRKHFSLFAEHSKHLAKGWDMSFSLMMHYYKANEDLLKWYPGIQSSYAFNKHWKLVASASNAMRLPTFTDLFYAGVANMGNKDLRPEYSWTYELGLMHAPAPGISYQATAFLRQGKDIIDWVWHDSLWRTENITELNTYGVELSANWQPHKLWQWASAWQALSLHYTYIDVSQVASELQSKYSANHLRHQLHAQGRFVLLKHLHLQIDAHYRSRVGNYQTYDFVNKAYGHEPYAPVLMLDARIAWQQKAWELFVLCKNITDRKVVEYAVPQPGIWLQAGAKMHLLW